MQTEVNQADYEALEKMVKRRRITIKEAVREAVASWIGLQTPLDEDPLFKIKPRRTGVKTDSSKLGELLYGRRNE